MVDLRCDSEIEVLSAADAARRRWSFGEKLRIVEESYQGHRQASARARRHGISSLWLFGWRHAFVEEHLGGVDVVPDLMPAVVVPDSGPSSEPAKSCWMKIVIGGDRRMVVGADVDGPALACVSRASLGRPDHRDHTALQRRYRELCVKLGDDGLKAATYRGG